jgi:hypothetical protein
MRYRLRTLLMVLAILPPLLAWGWWRYSAWKAQRDLRNEKWYYLETDFRRNRQQELVRPRSSTIDDI